MTTAYARAVSLAFGKSLRPVLMAAASGIVLAGSTSVSAAPVCTGDGNANTCIIGINPGEANIATETVDAGAGVDTLVFNAAGLTLDSATIGTTLGSPIRFANFEAAEITAGSSLTLSSATATSTTGSLTWTIDAGGTLTVLGGNAIGDTSAVAVNGTLNVNESEGIGALSGAATGSIVVANGKALVADGAATGSTFAGVISGAGGFSMAGSGVLTLSGNNTFAGPLTVAGGELILSGNNSFTGPLTVTSGTLEIQNAGAIDNASSVTINTNAQLTGRGPTFAINGPVTINGRLTGNAIITGAVSSNGGLQPGNTNVSPGTTIDNPGQDMGEITINGNYSSTGSSAYVGMFVDLDAAFAAPGGNGTPGIGGTQDFLSINGNVTGTTHVYLAEFDATADAGQATTGNGIQIIRVNGTNTGNEFVQGSTIAAGAYQYVMRYVADYSGTDDGYFLQSAVRDELIAQPALLSAGQAIVRQCFHDDQRVPDSPKGATYGRAWVGYQQGNVDMGPDTGIDMNLDYNCTTGGMDWRMGYGWFGGVSGGMGKANADIVTPAGGGNLDGSSRAIEVYASFTSSALFVNLSAGYTDMDWTYKNALALSVTGSSSGFIGSAQAGVALDADPFAVKLIGTLSYDGTNCGDNCLGVAVTEDTGLVEARGTVRIDGVSFGGSVRPWAQVSYSDKLSDGINSASIGAVAVSADTNSELLMFDAGLQAYLDENLAVYADGGYQESLSNDITGYKGGIGLKLYW